MTRTEKYKDFRLSIELENLNHWFEDFEDSMYIEKHQKEIKEEMGCKH